MVDTTATAKRSADGGDRNAGKKNKKGKGGGAPQGATGGVGSNPKATVDQPNGNQGGKGKKHKQKVGFGLW
jgi:hypothetical protein